MRISDIKYLFIRNLNLTINISKKIKLMSILFLLMITSGIILTTNYTSEGEITLSDSLLSEKFENLNASWNDVEVNDNGEVTAGKDSSGIKVIFGEDDNGNELKWWIVNRNGRSVTLYATESVQNGPFNSYLNLLPSVGNYGETSSNNWVTSSIRAFLARNQGEYPGDMKSRTGDLDGTASIDRSQFEEKYFTDAMIRNINPKNVTTYDSSGNEFNSVDRFWIPLAIGNKQSKFGTAITANPLAKPDDDINSSIGWLIPNRDLPGNSWTRSVVQNNSIYFNKTGQLSESIVTEIKSYLPIMELNLSNLNFISVIQGNNNNSDGVFKPIFSDNQHEYYLKFGKTKEAFINIDKVLSCSSELKVPYSLNMEKGYLMVFLTDLNNGETYSTSKIIERNLNGEAVLDLSNISNGKYEFKAWIEIPEENGGGIRTPSDIKTSTLNKGYEIKFEQSDNIQFFDEKNNEITSSSIIVDEGVPFSYIAKVNEDYNMSQIRTNLISHNSSIQGNALNPLNVSSVNPYSDIDSESIKPLMVGGGIITQGTSTVVYKTRAPKSYWSYTIPKVYSDITVKTTGATESNEYVIKLGTKCKKILLTVNINGVEINVPKKESSNSDTSGEDTKTKNSVPYTPGEDVDIEMRFEEQYDVTDLVAALVPQDWTEEIDVNGGIEQVIRESYMAEYNEYIKSNKIGHGATVTPTFKSDLVLFMEGETIKQHKVKFSSTETSDNIHTVGDIYQFKDGKEMLILKTGINVEYGSEIKVRFYLNEGKYKVKNGGITADLQKTGRMYNSTKKKYYYEWKFKITSDSDINIGNFELGRDVNAKIEFNNVKIETENETNTSENETGSFSKTKNDTVKYGSLYKFKVKPEDGYHWAESGISVKTDGREKVTLIKEKDDWFTVVIYSENDGGITENLNISVSGETTNSYVHKLSFESKASEGSIGFYNSNKVEIREIENISFLDEGAVNGYPVEMDKYSVTYNKNDSMVSFFPSSPETTESGDGTNVPMSETGGGRILGELKGLTFELPINIEKKTKDDKLAKYTGEISVDLPDQSIDQEVQKDSAELLLSLRNIEISSNDKEKKVEVSIVDNSAAEKKYNGSLCYKVSGMVDLTGTIKIDLGDGITAPTVSIVSLEANSIDISENSSGGATGSGSGEVTGEDSGDEVSDKISIVEVIFYQDSLNFISLEKEDIELKVENVEANITEAIFSGELKGAPKEKSLSTNSNSSTGISYSTGSGESIEDYKVGGKISANLKYEINLSDISLLIKKDLYIDGGKKTFSYDIKGLSLLLSGEKEIPKEYQDVNQGILAGKGETLSLEEKLSGDISIPVSNLIFLEANDDKGGAVKLISSIDQDKKISVTTTFNLSANIQFSELKEREVKNENQSRENTGSQDATKYVYYIDVDQLGSEGSIKVLNDSIGLESTTLNQLENKGCYVKGDPIVKEENQNQNQDQNENQKKGKDFDFPYESEDNKEVKVEKYIWIDTDIDISELDVKVFSGSVNFERLSEIPNIFKVKSISDTSKIVVLEKKYNIINFSSLDNINLLDAIDISVGPYSSSSSTQQLELIKDFNDIDKLLIENDKDFKFNIKPKKSYDISGISITIDNSEESKSPIEDEENSKSWVVKIKSDTKIKISGIVRKKAKLEYPIIGNTYISVNGNDVPKRLDNVDTTKNIIEVERGDTVSFVVEAEESYYFPLNENNEYNFWGIYGSSTDEKDERSVYNIPNIVHGKMQGYTVIVNYVQDDIELCVNDTEGAIPKKRSFRVSLRGPKTVSFKRVNKGKNTSSEESSSSESTSSESSSSESASSESTSSESISPEFDEWSVEEGENLEFSLKFEEGYMFDENNMCIYMADLSGNELIPQIDDDEKEGKIYRISNISSDVGVLVSIRGGSYKKSYIKFDWKPDYNISEKIEDAIKVEVPGRKDNFVKTGIPISYGEDVKFHVTVLDAYSGSFKKLKCEIVPPNDSEISLKKIDGEFDLSKRRFVYQTVGGVTSDVDIAVSGLELNETTLEFSSENAKIYLYNDGSDVNNGSETNDTSVNDKKFTLRQGDSFKFNVELENSFAIDSIIAVRKDSILNIPNTNVIREIQKDEGRTGDKSTSYSITYIIENLVGDVHVNVKASKISYNIKFETGTIEKNQEDPYFWIERVSGNGAGKIDNHKISVIHGEDTTIVFAFKKEYDKFDGGKTNKTSSGVGEIEISSGEGKLSNFVKDNDNNYLQITGNFTGESTVTLNNFKLNTYNIVFPETTKGYELYSSESAEPINSGESTGSKNSTLKPSTQIPADTAQLVDHGKPYTFFIRPLGGGFDSSKSKVTAVLSSGERITLEADKDYISSEYLKYHISEVLRDISIEILPKKQIFKVFHEGYNVSFYDVNKKPLNKGNSSKSKEVKIEAGNSSESNEVEIEAGERWTFFVKANEGYNIDNSTAKTNTGVRVLDKGIDSGGYRKYQIDSIDVDTTIIIENVQLNTYRIQFAKGEKVVVDDSLRDILKIYDDNGNKLLWDSNEKVLYGTTTHSSNFRFTYQLEDPYSKSELEFKPTIGSRDPNDGTSTENEIYKISQSNGYWEVKKELVNKGETITVYVDNININTYKISFSGKGIHFDDSSGNSISTWEESIGEQKNPKEEDKPRISHDTGEYVFRVKENIEDGYSIDSKLEVKATNGSVSNNYREGETSNGQKYKEYTLTGVTSDTLINVEGARSMFYTIDFKTDLNEKTDSTDTPPVGLRILDTDGRDISTGIRSPNGSSVKFSIVMDAEYTQLKPRVLVDEKELEIKDNYYTISNIKKSSTVMMEKLEGNKNKYEINFTQKDSKGKVLYYNLDGAQITEKPLVTHGESYSFIVKAENGYEVTDVVITSTNSEINYLPIENNPKSVKVTLSNIIGEVKVVIDNVTLTLYDIKFEFYDDDGNSADKDSIQVYAYGSDRNITNGTKVYYEKDLEFRLNLAEGYTKSKVIVEHRKGEETESINVNNGYYKIKNIIEGTTVKIGGIQKNKYSIRLVLPSADIKVIFNGKEYPSSNSVFNPEIMLEDKVEHGGSCEFIVKSNPGYNIKNLLVTTKDADVQIIHSSETSAIVVLSNIIGDLESVNISGVNKNVYLVSFSGTEFVSVFDENLKDITRTGKEVEYKGNIEFTLEPHEGYDRGKNNWKVSYETTDEHGGTKKGVIEKDVTGVWKYNGILDDVKISITNVEINAYTIEFSGYNVYFLNSVTDSDLNNNSKQVVPHGGYFTFKVKAEVGYDLLKMMIKSDVGDLFEEYRSDYEAIYTLSNITNDAKVIVKDIDNSKVEVALVPGTGTIYLDSDAKGEIAGKQTLSYGGTFNFSVGALEGYDINTLQVNANGVRLEETKGGKDNAAKGDYDYKKFSLEKLGTDCEISTSIEKKKYSISFPEVEGVKFYENDIEVKGKEAIIVSYGDNFRFRIALDDKHNQSSIIVKSNMKQGGETVSNVLSEIDGLYTITEISGNIDIDVGNVEINRYKVNLVQSEGITYNSGDASEMDIAGIHVVSYGETFSFQVSALDGYEISNMVVTVKEEDGSFKALTPSKGVYAITNIKGNKTVSVADQAKVQYKVTFEPADGVTYLNDTGRNIVDPILITHGHNFEFSIEIADAYDDSTPSIQTSSLKTSASKLATGRYLLSDITEDMTVKTLNVTKNKYSVTLKEITGVIYKDMNGRTLTGDQYVEYEGQFQFKVDLYPAYSESSITVMDGKEEVKPESDDSFLITGIMENKTITVTGIEENPEVKLINMINSLRDNIRDAADVDAVVEATNVYNQLSDAAKARVTNLDKLTRLQQESGTFIHTTNDISVEGVDWYIKLVAVPLSASSDEMGRIYGKLNTEFILSLYDIYLWDMISQKKYTLPEGEKVKISIPTPDLRYFKDTFIVHERSSDGKLEYLLLDINGNKTSFEMTSFSPVGMAAKRKVESTHSSFFDTIGANISEMSNIISRSFGNKKSNSGSSNEDRLSNKKPSGNTAFGEENIDEKFKQNGLSDARWSALRLLLVITVGFIICIVIITKNKRAKEDEEDTTKSSEGKDCENDVDHLDDKEDQE